MQSMFSKLPFDRFVLPLAALVSLAANGIGVDRAMPGVAALAKEAWREARSWNGRPHRAAGDYLNEARALAETAPGALALVRETSGAPLSSVERSTHLAVSFGRLPERTAWTGFFGMPAYDSLLLPWGEGERRRAELAAFGFEKRGETLAWELWTK